MPTKTETVLGLLRVALGWVFLWPFLDKTFGLGYSTPRERAWIGGGHPTRGFLNGADGWFADAFHAMAGSAVVEWLFMLGLLLVGLALILGVGVRVAAVSGAAMMLLMYAAEVPFKRGAATNPFLDEHVVYALALLALAALHAGRALGLGLWWSRRPVVQKNRWLE
jgi:thiosulfate dehydrogenase [quinone] large subunit